MLKWKYNIKTGLTEITKKKYDGTIFVDQDMDH